METQALYAVSFEHCLNVLGRKPVTTLQKFFLGQACGNSNNISTVIKKKIQTITRPFFNFLARRDNFIIFKLGELKKRIASNHYGLQFEESRAAEALIEVFQMYKKSREGFLGPFMLSPLDHRSFQKHVLEIWNMEEVSMVRYYSEQIYCNQFKMTSLDLAKVLCDNPADIELSKVIEVLKLIAAPHPISKEVSLMRSHHSGANKPLVCLGAMIHCYINVNSFFRANCVNIIVDKWKSLRNISNFYRIARDEKHFKHLLIAHPDELKRRVYSIDHDFKEFDFSLINTSLAESPSISPCLKDKNRGALSDLHRVCILEGIKIQSIENKFERLDRVLQQKIREQYTSFNLGEILSNADSKNEFAAKLKKLLSAQDLQGI